jgi:hypothetical protein
MSALWSLKGLVQRLEPLMVQLNVMVEILVLFKLELGITQIIVTSLALHLAII